MKDDHLYVVHISECIERVEKYTADGEEAFFADAKTQDAVYETCKFWPSLHSVYRVS